MSPPIFRYALLASSCAAGLAFYADPVALAQLRSEPGDTIVVTGTTVAIAGTATPTSEIFNPGTGRSVNAGARLRW